MNICDIFTIDEDDIARLLREAYAERRASKKAEPAES